MRTDGPAAAMYAAMEPASISSLCRAGQLELALQVAREMHPELGEDELSGFIEAETAS